MKSFLTAFLLVTMLVLSPSVYAAYESRFDAVTFEPAVDSGPYWMNYGSQTNKAWQGNIGAYFNYANRPLEFRGIGTTTGRQSVLDHTLFLDVVGSVGVTDWFTLGLHIPVGVYNHFFTDDATAASDHGGSMGDLKLVTKFRILNIDNGGFGLSVVPFVSLPTGDIVRYAGNGHIMGGASLVFDARFLNRVNVAANLGVTLRDDVTRVFTFTGGSTSTIRIDDFISYGLGVNVEINSVMQAIVEANGWTVIRDFLSNSNTTALEAGAGMRFFLPNSGFSFDVGGFAGVVEGVGVPRYRALLGVNWISRGPKECPECAPDPRIQDNKIVLWGKIFFDTNKATIKPISFPVLDDVVDVLQKNPQVQLVEVQGHTDWRGSDSFNLRLSQARAESAMRYIIDKGISPNRLRAMGYGESKPIASNQTVEGMSQNRRVEFVIISADDGFTTDVEGTAVQVMSSTTDSLEKQVEILPVAPKAAIKKTTAQKPVRASAQVAFDDSVYLGLGQSSLD